MHFSFILNNLKGNLLNNIILNDLLLLGGLSSNLNHLAASSLATFNWQFRTLPFGIFFVKFAHKGPKTLFNLFMAIFEICYFLTNPGPSEYFSENGCTHEFFLDEEVTITPFLVKF